MRPRRSSPVIPPGEGLSPDFLRPPGVLPPGLLFHGFFQGRPLLDAFGLNDFESLFNRRDGLLLATARTRRTYRLDLGGRAFFLKIQWMPRPRPRYFLRLSAYAREAGAYARMKAAGLRVPRVVALGERRRFGFLEASLLVTAGVPGAVDLETWARGGFPRRGGIPPAGELLAELDRTVAAAHDKGYRFGDLKWRNILAAPPGGTGSHLVFIDQRRFGTIRFRGRAAVAADARLLREEMKRWKEFLPALSERRGFGRTPPPRRVNMPPDRENPGNKRRFL